MGFVLEKKTESFNKTVRLPEDVIETIEGLARKNNMSFNMVVLRMVQFAIENMKD